MKKVAAFIAFLVIPALASAAPITFSFASVYYGANDVADSDAGATSSASASNNFGGGKTFTGDASGSASFGTLGAFASADLTGYLPSTYNDGLTYFPASAQAYFVDTVTPSGYAGDAYLVFSVDVEGTASQSFTNLTSGDPSAQGILTFYNGGYLQGPVTVNKSHALVSDSPGLTSNPFFVAAGQSLTFTVSLEAFVDPRDITALGTYDYSGIANFGSTATVVNIRAYSDIGLTNEITGFTLASASTTSYPHATPGGEAPEPAMLVLFGAGLLVVGRRFSRRSPNL